MFRLLILTAMVFALQSNKRIINVYTKNADNLLYKQQIATLKADKAGLNERDLLVETHVWSKQTEALFKKNHIKDDFSITLTGKDGGEKFRSLQPVTTLKLYAIIDAMPMRKDEMKQKKDQ